VALGVPSVLSASEMNFLLNPKHPDFKKIKISQPVDYRFDSRLLNR
jgi:RES domain-containing protein